jgi:hypothetical protein
VTYLFTLDSHDLYGPFNGRVPAMAWAVRTNKQSYQLLDTAQRLKWMSGRKLNKPTEVNN